MCLLVAVAGCGDDASGPGSGSVTGLVTTIDSAGFDDVDSFTVRAEGETFTFQIDPEVEYGFPLGHLQSHLTNAEPVVVEYEDRDGELIAQSIEDAPVSE